MNSRILKIIILSVVVVVFSALFHWLGAIKFIPWHIGYSDIAPFFQKALEPGLPYIDKLVEYPVMTGMFIQAMGFVGKTFNGYYIGSAMVLILLTGVSSYFLLNMADQDTHGRVLYFWALAPSMFLFSVYNWDVLTLFFVVLALYALRSERYYRVSAFLALGFSSKFYPIIYMLPLLIIAPLTKRGKLIVVLAFLLVVAAVNVPFMIAYYPGWFYFFSSNATRMPNVDSLWNILGLMIPSLLDVNAINRISLALFLLSSLWLCGILRKGEVEAGFFGVTLLFLLLSKVFSPQYLLWLLPFFALVLPPSRKLFYALELSNAVVLFSTLSFLFRDVPGSLMTTYVFVVARHCFLVFIFISLLYTLQRHGRVELSFSSLRERLLALS